MIAFPSIAAAKRTLADSEQRAAAAQARITAIDTEAVGNEASLASTLGVEAVSKILDRRVTLRRERRAAEIDLNLAVAAKDRDERRLRDADTWAARTTIDERCAEVTATIRSEYRPAATAIVALMATRWRLHATLQKAEKSAHGVPNLRHALISPEFCGSLRLPDVGPDGLRGNLWYRGEPAGLAEAWSADAVPLGEISVEAFAGKDKAADRAARAAKSAAAALVAAYEREARKIVSLLEMEAAIDAELEPMNQKSINLCVGLTALQTPAQRLTNGRLRMLAGAVFLPAPTGRDEPIWQPFTGWQRRASL